jgi:hypothetical protein
MFKPILFVLFLTFPFVLGNDSKHHYCFHLTTNLDMTNSNSNDTKMIFENHAHVPLVFKSCEESYGNIMSKFKTVLIMNDKQEIVINSLLIDGSCIYEFKNDVVKFSWLQEKGQLKYCIIASNGRILTDVYFDLDRTIYYQIYID